MFKKIIFIECDLAIRDATTYIVLAKWLEKKLDVEVVMLGRNNLKFFLKNFNDCIFILTPQHYLKKATNDKNFYFILETEGYLNRELIELAYFNPSLQNKRKLNKISKIFVWNENTKKILKSHYNINKDKLIVVGNPRLCLYSSNKRKNKIKNIGLISRQVSLSNFKNESNVTKLFRSYIDKKRNIKNLSKFAFEKQIFMDIENLLVYFKILDSFKNEKKIKFSLKPHPNENPKDYHFLTKLYSNLEITNVKDFNDWLKNIDAIITPSSSTSVEASLKNLPIFFTGVGEKKETFYKITKNLSYKINPNNKYLNKTINKHINQHQKLKSKKFKFLNLFKKKYLNNGKINFDKIYSSLNKNIYKIKKYSPLKIYILIFFFDVRYLFSCIKNRNTPNFKYLYSPFFSNYKLNKEVLTKLLEHNGVLKL